MASVIPKLKMFLFISTSLVLLSLGVFIYNSAINNSLDLLSFIGGIAGAFVPFGSLFSVVLSGITESILMAFLLLLTGVLSGIQAYLLVVIVANFVPTIDV